MTKMEKFAFNLCLDQGKKGLSPNLLAAKWAELKGIRRASSREMFGTTSAAYRVLRKLAKEGKIERIVNKTVGGYSYEMYYYHAH